MSIEENAEKVEGLPEKAWNYLVAAEKAETRLMSEENITEFYRIGIVDYKKFSEAQWKQLFKTFSKNEEQYLISTEQWKKISDYFYKGNIRKPFDPSKIKPGLKPLNWLYEFYQKVGRFEMALTAVAWKNLVDNEIQTRFIKNQKLIVDSKFKEFLAKLLEEQPSRLRQLELWFHQERAEPVEQSSSKATTPVVIRDSFQAKPEEIKKKAAIDKLYFQHEQKPEVNDRESLDFLDELAQNEDEEDLL